MHLTLLIGPSMPVPVPQPVIDALDRVEVSTGTQSESSFQLEFTLSRRSVLNTLYMVAGGQIPADMRVILIVTINGTPEVIVDGIITHHEAMPGAQAGSSRMTIRGSDLSELMNRQEFPGLPYPGMPPEARVAMILGKYAGFGVVPVVVPMIFADVPSPTGVVPLQRGTDLQYVRQLAAEAGYVFYVTPTAVPGVNVAYWGPEVKVGLPQPALNTNMDAHTNTESLSFSFDSAGRTQPVVTVHEPVTKIPIPIPIPEVGLLNPPLGAVLPAASRFERLGDVSKLSLAKAFSVGLSAASRSSETVRAEGTLDVRRYGRVLKPRGLVGVRGAGLAFDGLYYVERVTHRIERGRYQQSFTLTRNGVLSTVPRVPA